MKTTLEIVDASKEEGRLRLAEYKREMEENISRGQKLYAKVKNRASTTTRTIGPRTIPSDGVGHSQYTSSLAIRPVTLCRVGLAANIGLATCTYLWSSTAKN